MMKKSWLLAVVGMLALSVSGCIVKESTYLKKVEEAGSLEQGLATCKEEVERLGKQNEELVKKVQSQQEQIGQIEKNREEKVQEVSKTYTQMIEKMKSEIAEGQVTITELQGRLTVNMVDAILFDSGRADIKPEGRQGDPRRGAHGQCQDRRRTRPGVSLELGALGGPRHQRGPVSPAARRRSRPPVCSSLRGVPPRLGERHGGGAYEKQADRDRSRSQGLTAIPFCHCEPEAKQSRMRLLRRSRSSQ
jgi:gas vesicle protein